MCKFAASAKKDLLTIEYLNGQKCFRGCQNGQTTNLSIMYMNTIYLLIVYICTETEVRATSMYVIHVMLNDLTI